MARKGNSIPQGMLAIHLQMAMLNVRAGKWWQATHDLFMAKKVAMFYEGKWIWEDSPHKYIETIDRLKWEILETRIFRRSLRGHSN
jgi:hypothetical protein